MSEPPETALKGGSRSIVTRQGEVIFRETGAWALSVHRFLHHLREQGLDFVPEPVGTGFDAAGREVLTYLEGEFVHPGPWTDAGLVAMGQMLRQLHDAAKSFPAADGDVWQPWFLHTLGGPRRIIGHGDIAPWNTITRDGLPIGLIDWEYTGPLDPLVELARVCWLFPQLHDDDVAERVGLPPLEVRARQLRLLVDAYGLPRRERAGMFDRILAVAVHETANEAIEFNVTPESEGPLWGFAWRARAAAWMLCNRASLERVLG